MEGSIEGWKEGSTQELDGVAEGSTERDALLDVVTDGVGDELEPSEAVGVVLGIFEVDGDMDEVPEFECVAVILPEGDRVEVGLPEGVGVAVEVPESVRVTLGLPEGERVAVILPEGEFVPVDDPEGIGDPLDVPEREIDTDALLEGVCVADCVPEGVELPEADGEADLVAVAVPELEGVIDPEDEAVGDALGIKLLDGDADPLPDDEAVGVMDGDGVTVIPEDELMEAVTEPEAEMDVDWVMEAVSEKDGIGEEVADWLIDDDTDELTDRDGDMEDEDDGWGHTVTVSDMVTDVVVATH